MTVQQFLLILKARFWLGFSVFILIVLLIGAFSAIQPKKYEATSALVIDVKSSDLLTGLMQGSNAGPSFINTQVDIIKSPRTAKKVVELLKLNFNAETIENWYEATNGEGDLITWIANSLTSGLIVVPSRQSNVIEISYISSNPETAEKLANTFALAYMDVYLDLKVEPARQFSKFFEEQTDSARTALEKSQKRLSSYLRDNDITSVDNRIDIETEKLNAISNQLTSVQGITTESQSKRGSENFETIAEVMQNPLVNQLKSQVAQTESKLIEAKVSYGANHPQTTALSAEVSALKRRLSLEVQKVMASIDTTYEVNKQREAHLKKALEDQKARVIDINQQRDKILILQRDVDAAQRIYEAVSQRATQTTLESQTNQTNVTILTEAVVPTTAANRSLVVTLFIAGFLGTIFAIGLLLMLELVKRKVRCQEDLSSNLNLSVLGNIGSAKATIKVIENGVRS